MRPGSPDESLETLISSRFVFPAVALCLFFRPRLAHDFWIEPLSFSPQAGSPVHEREKILGRDFPRDRNQLKRFLLIGPGGEERIEGRWGDSTLGTAILPVTGSYTIFYESRPSISRLAVDEFRDYLEEESAQIRGDILPEQGEVVESFSRFAKTILLLGSSKGTDLVQLARSLDPTLRASRPPLALLRSLGRWRDMTRSRRRARDDDRPHSPGVRTFGELH